MKPKHRCFEITHNQKIVRDSDGRYYLHDRVGQRKELDRDDARKLLNQQIVNDKINEFQFIRGIIGEQWFGHKEFFEHGKVFIQIGRNELSRDWKETFGLMFSESHQSTAYNFLHGIELGLKAYMLFKDERLLPIDLKARYGHHIQKLLIDARGKGLEIERCVVIPHEDQSEDEDDGLGSMPENNWPEQVFGKASSVEEKRFDIAIGINFERYALKGTEYPISIYEEQEHYYLASIAGMAYTLFNEIRNIDGFFDQKRRDRHSEFDTWLRELHTHRKNYILSEQEAVEKLDELNAFFAKCDSLPGPNLEPDWEEQLELIKQSKGSGTTNT